MIPSGQSIHKWRSSRAARYTACLLFLAAPVIPLSAQPHQACNPQQAFGKIDGLLKDKQYDEAQAALHQLQSCHNLSALETFNLGWFYGRARDFKTALTIFKTVPPNVPDVAIHQYAVALGQFELQDYHGAVETLKGLQSQGLLDAKSANLLGVSYSKLGLYHDAYPVLTDEIRRDPHDLMAYLNLVALLVDSADFKDAADTATRATEAFPDDPEVFVVLGAADSLLGKFEKAYVDFAKAIQLAPREAEPRFLLALTDYKQRNFARAITELRSAIGSGIVDSDLHYLLAECMLQLDASKTKDALAELNQAIEINPNSVSARTLRGRLLLEEKRPKEAIVDLEVAYHIDSTSHSAAYTLARAYSAAGRKDEAKILFARLSKQFQRDLEDQNHMEIVDELSQQRLKKVLAGGSAQ